MITLEVSFGFLLIILAFHMFIVVALSHFFKYKEDEATPLSYEDWRIERTSYCDNEELWTPERTNFNTKASNLRNAWSRRSTRRY